MKNTIAGYDNKEWEKLLKEYETDKTRYREKFKSLNEHMSELLENETSTDFMSKTGLTSSTLTKLKKYATVSDPVAKSTIMSVAVGYELDINMVLALLELNGSGFNRFNDRDYAYTFILTRHRGKDIDECNEILKELGIPEIYWLGSKVRKRSK